MKAFLTWLAVCVSGFALSTGGYHLYLSAHPTRVLVIVDSSFEMQSAWPRLPRLLKQLSERRYAEFALATEKRTVHGWSDDLSLGRITPYAPRDLSHLRDRGRFAIIDEADIVYLVTNASPGELQGLPGIDVVHVD